MFEKLLAGFQTKKKLPKTQLEIFEARRRESLFQYFGASVGGGGGGEGGEGGGGEAPPSQSKSSGEAPLDLGRMARDDVAEMVDRNNKQKEAPGQDLAPVEPKPFEGLVPGTEAYHQALLTHAPGFACGEDKQLLSAAPVQMQSVGTAESSTKRSPPESTLKHALAIQNHIRRSAPTHTHSMVR